MKQLLCTYVGQKQAMIHITLCVFSKKFCIVVEKPFKTKCSGLEVLSQILNLNALLVM